ncbi:MAG: hypothetical protein AVDCRST_MAG74-905 [uncultured Pyrinomonadaceae bacterium]|uniref:CHAT domain-containing protein n=1 Tax=uncultured Pyrinomonadaceae bacterium TaxID=2283094 RepID=A0A6J4NJF8_9BACT|nr:MAG: hypothetical protein AVDCRST_MAG74-905 [uncultured Pyrinomonadaceae bacterium]
MNFKDLAEKLIEAKKESDRKILLEDLPESNFLKLAQALRDTYYESWTNEPRRVQKAAQALDSLVKIKPAEEIKALSFWVAGVALLTEGKFDSALNTLDKSAEIFQTINKEYEAARTQVAKLYPLALLGRYHEAVVCGKNALKIFEKYGDELTSGKIEMNLGNTASRCELHAQAEKFYLAAHERFLKNDETTWLTMAKNGLAITYAALNQFKKAENFYSQALRLAKAAKMSVTEAEIEASMGNLALFRGDYNRALKFLELSRRKYETLQMPHQTAVAALEIADVYLELNLTAEAVAIYERVAGELRKLKMQGEEARARANFGRVAAVLNRTATARRELKKAALLYVLENNKVGAATVKLNEAMLELNLQNYRKALNLTEEAESFLNQSENIRHLLSARWLRAEALRNLGENEKARQLLFRVYAESIKQEQPNTAQTAQISLGKLAASEEDYAQAKKHFRGAIRLIERARAPLAAEEFRMAFLADKLTPFELIAKIHLAENKFKAAFLMIEKARSRSLAESLGNSSETANDGENKVSAELLEKLEIAREQLNWFYSRLRRADDAEIENLQTEAKKREKAVADLLRQIASTDESKFGERHFLDFARLQDQLGERRALLEFVNFDGNLSVFVVTDKKIRFVADLAKESEILRLLENLHFQFGSLRYGARVLESFLPELKKRALFYLRKLYEKLIKPIEIFIEKRDLTIVPVGALYYVPFHALYDDTNYQIEMREIVYAPSATVWQFLASKPQRKLRNALLIGYADERIPLVAREIENLKKIFTKSKSLTGERATFAAFTENARRFDVLHLACHGQFRPENPLFSSLHLADGFVTVRDVCAQKLRAEIVTLSACETGLNKIFAGDEILGLARGFLSAGAKSLVLSLWAVNDEATADLMQNFYAELQTGKTASEALKIAQCKFIERGVHPYFWSPFALIGR